MNPSDQPATKQDLADLKNEMVQVLEHALERAFEGVFEHAFEQAFKHAFEPAFERAFQHAFDQKLEQALERTETKLLGAFFSYQEYNRIESRKFKSDLSNINAAAELRFENIDSRLSIIEKIVLAKPDPKQ